MNLIGGSDSFCGDFKMLWGDVYLVGSPAETFFEDCARDAVPARKNKNTRGKLLRWLHIIGEN